MWHTKLSVSMDIPVTEVTGRPRTGRVPPWRPPALALRSLALAPPLAPPDQVWSGPRRRLPVATSGGVR